MIKETLTIEQAEEIFIDCLDSGQNPELTIGTLTFMASAVLKKMDPIAYREEFLCFLDSLSDDYEIEGY
jgi:hypothetical protein